MTDFTQEQLTLLNQAIAEGVTKIEYNGKKIEYRSLKEMIETRDLIKRELNPLSFNSTNPNRKIGVFSSGL